MLCKESYPNTFQRLEILDVCAKKDNWDVFIYYREMCFKIKTTQALHNNQEEEVVFKTPRIIKRTLQVHHEYVR